MRILIALLTLAAALPSLAQTYPSKPIRVIVPSAPGVGTDLTARGFGAYVGAKLGQPFVIENRVGADGAIGMEMCARAAPDGYTLCSGASNTLAFNPVVKRNLPYAPEDFAPIVLTGFFDSGLAVNASFPAQSLQQFLDLARAKKESVTWGTFDVVGQGFLYMEWFKKNRGVQLLHVPYKAPPQLLQALVTGEVNSGVFAVAQMQTQIRSGKVRLLAVTSEARHPLFPEVPTFGELGIRLPLRSWYGIATQAAVPREIIQRLNAEMDAAIRDPEWRAKYLIAIGVEPAGGSADKFAAFWKKNMGEFAELIRSLGIKPG